MIVIVLAAMFQATMPFTTVTQGNDSRIREPREVVIRSAVEWQTLWREHSPQAPPVVDFSDSIVVGIFLGSRPTAGYGVEVVAIGAEGDSILVEYRERAPAPGALAAQVLTSPFQIVTFPRNGRDIRFRKVEPPA